jgi:type IV pilus assembly protein PilC
MGRILLKTPVIKSLSLKLATARFCRTLGTLLVSGLQLMKAVAIAGKTVGNKYLESRLRTVPDQLARGLSLAPVLSDCNIFPRTVIRMTAAGESTGRLGEMFSKAADFYESEIDTEITAMTSVIEPLIILILGLAVAFILIAMYLPLFDLIGQMGS